MNKRLAGIAVFLILVCLGFWYLFTQDITVDLTGPQIQEKLDATFPIEKTYVGVVNVEFSHPVVTLKEGSDRVNFAIDAGVNVLSNTWQKHGAGQFSGKVRFDPENGNFYLDDPRVEKIQIDGLPEQYGGIIASGADLAIAPYLQSRPIGHLKTRFFQSHGVNLAVKNVVVKDGTLRITIGRAK